MNLQEQLEFAQYVAKTISDETCPNKMIALMS